MAYTLISVCLSIPFLYQGYRCQPDPVHNQTRWWTCTQEQPQQPFTASEDLDKTRLRDRSSAKTSVTRWALGTDPYGQLWMRDARTYWDLKAVLTKRMFIVIKATDKPVVYNCKWQLYLKISSCWTDCNSSFPPNDPLTYSDQYHTVFVHLGQWGPGFLIVFFLLHFCHFCHLMAFGFLGTVASGLLSWGHLIFNTITDLTALTLLDVRKWTELEDDIIVFAELLY